MIHCNLSVLLAERQLKISRVAAETGISRTTLTALAYNNCQGIQMTTLNTLCLYLEIQPNDLFSFYPYDLILKQVEGSPELFTAQYFIRSRLFSTYCTLSGSASVLSDNGQWVAANLQLEFTGADSDADHFFADAFSRITPSFKTDLEVDLFKKFVGDILDPYCKLGPKYEMRFDVIWP